MKVFPFDLPTDQDVIIVNASIGLQFLHLAFATDIKL